MNITIFGDSIVWGAYDPVQGGWATRLRNYFESADSPPYFREGGDVMVYPLGIPGDTTMSLLERLETEARARTPEIIIFAIGINDTQFVNGLGHELVPLTQFCQNLENLLTIARQFTPRVFFVGLARVDETKTRPIAWDETRSYSNETIEQYDQALADFCMEKKLTYIPLAHLISFGDLFDGLHPNSTGHEKIFRRMWDELAPLFGTM